MLRRSSVRNVIDAVKQFHRLQEAKKIMSARRVIAIRTDEVLLCIPKPITIRVGVTQRAPLPSITPQCNQYFPDYGNKGVAGTFEKVVKRSNPEASPLEQEACSTQQSSLSQEEVNNFQ